MESRLKDLEQKLQQAIEENLFLKNELAKVRGRSPVVPPETITIRELESEQRDNFSRIPEYYDDWNKVRYNHWNCDYCGTSNHRVDTRYDECGKDQGSQRNAVTGRNKVLLTTNLRDVVSKNQR